MSVFFENGQMVIEHHGRRVATTEGTLLQFLTTEQVFTSSITFPDAIKTQLYSLQYVISDGGGRWGAVGTWYSAVGARPQEWKSTVVLGSAPAGADLWVGRVSLVRTKAPSHTWLGQTIDAIGAQETQLWGSMVVEEGPAIARGLTIDVVPSATPGQPGQLVAKLEQTVGPAAGNFGITGYIPAGAPGSGVENVVAGGGAALPVFWRLFAPYYHQTPEVIDFGTTAGDLAGSTPRGWANSRRFGGANAAAYDDPTDYSSIYTLTVRGRFGRRS